MGDCCSTLYKPKPFMTFMTISQVAEQLSFMFVFNVGLLATKAHHFKIGFSFNLWFEKRVICSQQTSINYVCPMWFWQRSYFSVTTALLTLPNGTSDQ